jgi:hypothetical protein
MKRTGIQLIDNNDSGEVMDIKISPELDGDGKIVSGIVVGDTLEQNKALILIGHQGDFKFNPEIGVGLSDVLLGNDHLSFRHRIREHFAMDGLQVSQLDLYPKKPLKIIADYE